LRVTDFKDALRETEGTFIKIDNSYASYHNPSVRDFIHSYIKENDIEFKMLCKYAADFDFCILPAYLDQDLCRAAPEEFTAALWRTANKDKSLLMAKQIRDLQRADYRLGMAEELIQRMLERFLDKLEKETRELSEDT